MIFWMHNDDGGSKIKKIIIPRIESEGIEVWSDIDFEKCIVKNNAIYHHDGRRIDDSDLIYHSNWGGQTKYQKGIFLALEDIGVKLINPFKNYLITSDKFRANFILKRNGLPVAESILVNNNLHEMMDFLAVYKKIVIKPRFGCGGHGIIKIDNKELLYDFFEYTHNSERVYYAEEYIDGNGKDIRLDVIDSVGVGSYGRHMGQGWKTNLHSGGYLYSTSCNEDQKTIAIEAVSTLGLYCSIVDMMVDKTGRTYIIEVNPSLGVFHEAYLGNSIPKEAKNDDKKVNALVDLLVSKINE